MNIRIEPQWNVNDEYTIYIALDELDQNRTIVECKYCEYKRVYFKTKIRIEPQWNVNWKDNYSNTGILDQNRTIVECK